MDAIQDSSSKDVKPSPSKIPGSGTIIEKINSKNGQSHTSNKLTIFFEYSSTHSLFETPTVQWSSDDHISLITEKGVLIFSYDAKFIDSNSSFQSYPNKYFIPNPTKPLFFKIHDLIVTQSSEESAESSKSRCSPLLYPLFLNDGYSSSYLKYQLSAWSPPTHLRGCILALLTYENHLVLYCNSRTHWIMVEDISELLDSSLSIMNRKCLSQDLLQELKELTIVCMAWSEIFFEDSIETCILVCGTSSGHCHFFKILIRETIKVALVQSWASGLGSISFLSWNGHFLTICSFNGPVLVIRLPPKFLNPSWDDFVTVPRAIIWKESDSLPVQHIVFRDILNNSLEILFAKRNFIIIATIKEHKVARKSILTTASIKIHEASFMSPCTGLCISTPSKFIVSCLEKPLIEFTQNSDGSISEKEIFTSNEIIQTCTSYGLASSPNHALICLAQTLASYHDHLVLKEQTKLYVLSNLSFEELTKEINLLSSNSYSAAKNLQKKSLMPFMDLFQALRGYYSTGNYWIPDELDILLKGKPPSNNENPLRLKCMRFVAICLLSCGNNKLSETNMAENLRKAIESLEESILNHHVDEVFSKISNDNTEKLTKAQLQSLRNMSIWSKRQIHLKQLKDPRNFQDSCPICGEFIPLDNQKQATCPNGHKFARCANSLLLCDCSKVKYEMCRLCGEHSYAIPSIWEDYYQCLFCF